jgi:Exo70 exocyst complex subunit
MQSLFRSELKGKLPFLSEPRKFATGAVSALLTSLEARVTAAHRDPAVLAVAMLNNLRFLVVGIAEHDQLPAVFGSSWQKHHREAVMPRWQELYLSTTWQPLKELLRAACADAAPAVRIRLRVQRADLGPPCSLGAGMVWQKSVWHRVGRREGHSLCRQRWPG